MQTQVPQALLMDLGNVLVKVDPAAFERFFLDKGINLPKTGIGSFLNLIHGFETGAVDTEDFLSQGCKLIGLSYPEQKNMLSQAWLSIIQEHNLIEVTFDVCLSLLQRHIPVIIFSNINPLHIAHINTIYPGVLDKFTERIYSCEVKGEKPGPVMYEYAIHQLGLVPEQTLYFDDREENIEAGRKFGFQAYVFDYNNPSSFLDFLPAEWKITPSRD